MERSVTYLKLNRFIFVIFLTVATDLGAQSVGIGGEPHSNAVLAITSTSKGLLIPRLTSAQRVAIPSPANGLMVYDKTLKCFFYYNSRKGGWVDMKPTPSGMITLWYGTLSDYFEADGNGKGQLKGWALCNGNNGTPNLQGLFIMGNSGSNIGASGGLATHQLTANQIPSHTHSVSDPGHSHGVTLGTTSHSHTFTYLYSTTHADYAMADDGSNITYDGGGTVDHEGTTIDAAFSSSITGGSAGVSVNSTGSGSQHENRPPYYVLAYIMKK